MKNCGQVFNAQRKRRIIYNDDGDQMYGYKKGKQDSSVYFAKK